jgi:hypothetical protein
LYKRTRLYRRLKINRNTAESIGVLLDDLMRSRTPFSVISLPRTEFLRSTAVEPMMESTEEIGFHVLYSPVSPDGALDCFRDRAQHSLPDLRSKS